MAVRIPTSADLPTYDPRPATRLPQYPDNDPVALAQVQFGKGISQVGGALIDMETDQKAKTDKLNEAIATVDLFNRIVPLHAAISKETDPDKVERLKAEYDNVISTSSGAITDPYRRQLWGATHAKTILQAHADADGRVTDLRRGRARAGALEQADLAIKNGASADNDEAFSGAALAIDNVFKALEEDGSLTPEQAYKARSQSAEKLIIGRADWLSANGRHSEAAGFIQKHGRQIDPDKLRSYSDYLKPRVDKEAGQGLLESTAPGARLGHINYGATGALGDPTKPGWEAENITPVSSPSGAKFRVHKAAAADFSGFLRDLEDSGYQIKPETSGGHNVRKMRGGDQLSEHSYGTAIDINSDSNLFTRDGRKVTDLPPQVAELAAKHNLEWGGNWKDPVDTMHFQWRGPASATADNNFGGIRKRGVIATKADGGFESYGSPEAGVKAISDTLDRYAGGGMVTATNPEGKPLNTLRSIVSTWAPPHENDTPALITRASKVTGYEPDQVLNLSDPAVKAKVIEATIRNEQGGKLPIDKSLIERVASGATLSAEVPTQPKVPDWRAWNERIDAAPGYTKEQKDYAKAQLRQKHSEFSLGQAEAASDLTLAINRGERGREDIESQYQAGRISPEKRTQLNLHLDDLEEKQRLREDMISRAALAANGGAPLDPKEKKDRDALNLHYEETSKLWAGLPAEKVVEKAVDYAVQIGMVPDRLKNMVRGGLHAGRPELAIQATDTLERLRNANPQLVGEFGDENDLRLAALIRSNTDRGMPPKEAVQAANDSLKVDKATREARVDDFKEQRGKTERDRARSDDRWIEGKQHSMWSVDPRVDVRMRKDFEVLTEGEFVKTGDLEAARSRALDTINRIWGRTRVGSGSNIRYERHAPEKFYGVPTLSPDTNSDWMNEQLISEVATEALTDPANPITIDRLLVIPSESQRNGRPLYNILLKDSAGNYNIVTKPNSDEPRLWAPSWETSAEYKRRQIGQTQTEQQLRNQRARPRPGFLERVLQAPATMQEQIGRGSGETP